MRHYPSEIARELLMQDADPGDMRDDLPYRCECGFESKSLRSIGRHVKGCAEANATPEEREAWYRARHEEEVRAFAAEMRDRAIAESALPCNCAPEYEYTCAGCEARRYLKAAEPAPA